jgi:hypothetical protein
MNASVGDVDEAAVLTTRDAVLNLYERLNCFIHLGVAYGFDYQVPESQMLLASIVTTMAERFVFCHEIGLIP